MFQFLLKCVGLAEAEQLRRAIALSLEQDEDEVDEEELLKMAIAMSLAEDD